MKGDQAGCFHPSAVILHPCCCPRSSGVERLLGKEEVMSSNLIAGSIYCGFAPEIAATISECLLKRPIRNVKGKIRSE
jgi:hypothetical protein